MDRILSAGAAACLKKPLDVEEVRGQVVEAFNLREYEGRRRSGGRDESPKVLIVTQNADFRSRVRDELAATRPPVEVLTAQTGADALLVAQAAPPQYVILSLSVPDVEGSKVIEKLAKSAHGIQIIAVHDDPNDDIRTAARTAGARMCLPTAAVTGSVRELLGV
jgi:CheY-like chemotaxis protein